MKISENIEEITKLGYEYLISHPEEYPNYIDENLAKFGIYFDDKEKLLSILYRGVYFKEVYGASLFESGYYRFVFKSHKERTQYITWDNRFLYMAFLNKEKDNHILDNKYEAYTLLKPFYKREAMLLSDESDYEEFCAFVKRNPNIFVKPNNLELSEGAHRLVYEKGDLKNTFNALLKEAANISSTEVKREIDHRLILEEHLRPSEFISMINPNEISIFRLTTVYIKGQVHFLYPCARLYLGDGREEDAEMFDYTALIDLESGEIVTNGFNGMGDVEFTLQTGIKIKGLKIPDWDELKDMVEKAAKMLPNTRYIGWDIAHTDKGWCIVEGNTNGEFFFQMCLGHGIREEFENLIGFKVPYDFFKNPMFKKK